MQNRRLGKNGPLVSAMGLGCMGMSMGYGPRNDAESIKTLHRAVDLGVTLFDTADMYGWGHNEELLGKALKPHRNQLVISTKMGFARRSVGEVLDYYIDGSPSHIHRACDASLQRLNLDVIDIYYLHRVDPTTPIEDSIGAMADLVKSGKIRHIGISEVKPATIRRAAAVHPIAAVQTEYSIWERNPEREILPVCEELGIGFVAYCPLGRGFLTGAVTDIDKLSQDDFRRLLPRFQGVNFSNNQKILNKLSELAERYRCSNAQLALSWLLSRSKNIVPIPGTTNAKHLDDNIGAENLVIPKEELDKIDIEFPLNIASGKKYPDEFDKEA